MSTNPTEKHFPACYLELPTSTGNRRAAFYLAAEEYVAQQLPPDNYLFTWQLRPTVVMGRNQVAHQEVDLDFCQREGIDIIRRRSGGGAIFADERNIMTSLITPGGAVEPLFKEYAERVAEGLRQLGAPAVVSGRNDITLEGGGKICGNAFYHLTDHNIVHGTMLYDTDPRLMQGALHPDTSKLEEKGVKSVRSRVALLKDYLSIDVCELRNQLRLLLTDRTLSLTAEDVERIEEIEQRYYEPNYLLGSSATADVTRSARIPGCGQVDILFHLQGSLISKAQVQGDYFELGDANEAFSKALVGIAFTPEQMAKAIKTHHPEQTIRGLNEEQLTNLIL